MHTSIIFSHSPSTPHHKEYKNPILDRKKIQQSWYDDVALFDNTLNTFKHTQPIQKVFEGAGEETCGKLKAYHVKNYPTHYKKVLSSHSCLA